MADFKIGDRVRTRASQLHNLIKGPFTGVLCSAGPFYHVIRDDGICGAGLTYWCTNPIVLELDPAYIQNTLVDFDVFVGAYEVPTGDQWLVDQINKPVANTKKPYVEDVFDPEAFERAMRSL